MNRSPYRHSLTLFLFFLLSLGSSAQQKFKVALDAGHGDHDFGAVYHGHIEKKIALEVVLKVGRILEKRSDMEIIYTRKTDVFIDLIERANIANRADANIFVSIHCNANKNTAASGCETYVMGMSKNASNLEAARKENKVVLLEKDYKEKYQGFDPKDPGSIIGIDMMNEMYLENSIALAGSIQKNFIDLGKKSRGVKQAPFMVLHKAYMPRVLIEMGFISNPEEGAILDSEAGQNDIAQAIADAIISYKKEYFGAADSDTSIKPSQKIEPTPAVPTPTPAKPDPKTEIKTPEVKPEVVQENVSKGVVFKVQLSASGKKLDLVPSNFNGLSNLSLAADGSLYKYMYGNTSNYEEAKRLLQEAKAKGYTTAFIIAFKDGKKVSVQEALKN